MARDNIVEIIVGAIVLAVAGFFLTYSLSSTGRGTSGYELTAVFPDVSGLSVGGDVRLAGVPIGSISAIDLDPATFEAEVRFVVANGVELPIDSNVRLKGDGLLGGVHVSVEPGIEAEYLAGGDYFDAPGQGSVDVLRLLAEFVAGGRE